MTAGRKTLRAWLRAAWLQARIALCLLPGIYFCAKVWQGWEAGDVSLSGAAGLTVCAVLISGGLAYMHAATSRSAAARREDERAEVDQ